MSGHTGDPKRLVRNREKRLLAGLCVDCRNFAAPFYRCFPCRLRASAYNAEYRERGPQKRRKKAA